MSDADRESDLGSLQVDNIHGRRWRATARWWRRGCRSPRYPGSFALLALGLVATGCSGGGGGAGSSGRHPPGFFETQEYFANAGLEVLEASSAYASGATGNGIVVGVIDTGIDVDHPEFAGAIHQRSTDIVSGSAAFLDDVTGHGTAVAGVIAARRNGALAHGVAFDAPILMIRADAPGSCPGACAFDPLDMARATDYAVEHGARVINYSVGGAGSLDGALGDALEAAVDAGRILVLAAGNDGGDDPVFPAVFAGTPEARGRAIAVGALDSDGEIADFSNRPGSARQFFLVAPGVDILAPWPGGAALVSGTSFAAPHVTGAAALVLDAAPFLSPRQVVELLLDTATDLGAPGTDDVYGRGLLNLAAALGPQGPLTIPLGSAVDGGGAGLRQTGLRLGGAFGRGPDLGRAIFLDGYGRPYWVDLDQRRAAAEFGPDLLGWLAPDQERLAFSAPLGARDALSLELAAPREHASFGPSAGRSDVRLDERFALSAALGGASRLAMSHGWSLQDQFGLANDQRSALPGLLAGGAFASPYLALADGGDGLAIAQQLDDRWSLRIGLARADRDDRDPYASGDNRLVLGELVGAADGLRLGLQLGRLEEQDRVLDASGGGALGLGAGSSTTFVGLAGRTELSSVLELFGQASLGLTRPVGGEQGLIQDLSVLYSSSFGLGLVRRDLAVAGDRLTVAVAQPLRVEAGDAALDRPLGRTFDGQIVRRRERIALAPAGRELDLEVGYRVGLAGIGHLSVNWLTRVQPGHDPEASPDHALALRLERRF
jgi:Subtilase family